MKVLHLSYADSVLGAARAAYRIHRALLDFGVESRMRVRQKRSDDWTVGGPSAALGKALTLGRPQIGEMATCLQRGRVPNIASYNIVPSWWARSINDSDIDLVVLHWLGAEAMSIADIGRIRKPLVMTLHDMWAFCGAEHYTSDEAGARWRQGYRTDNRVAAHRGWDIDRWTWNRKRKSWTNTINVVCPSQWLADCARESALMRGWNISTVPYTLDLDIFKPLDRAFCRWTLNLPSDQKIILFGAWGALSDGRKGYDLLLEALRYMAVRGPRRRILCVIFGQSQPREAPNLPFPTRWIGRIHDDVALALLYNAADVMIVPSRQENLGQTGLEAQACGCPVVAFATGGMRDVVQDRVTGYLAEPFSTGELAAGIGWIVEDDDRRMAVGSAARTRALRLWSSRIVVPQYLEVYQRAMGSNQASSQDLATTIDVFSGSR